MKTVKLLAEFEAKFKAAKAKAEADKPKQADIKKFQELTEERESLLLVSEKMFQTRYTEIKEEHVKLNDSLKRGAEEYKADMLKRHKAIHDDLVNKHKRKLEERHEEFFLNVLASIEKFKDEKALLHTELFERFDVEKIMLKLSSEIREKTINHIEPVVNKLSGMLETAKTYHRRESVINEALALGMKHSTYRDSDILCPPQLKDNPIIEQLRLYKVRVQFVAFE